MVASNMMLTVGIRTGYYHAGLSPAERDALIMKLHRRGVPQREIGKQLGLTQQAISKAIRRIAAGRPGRDARG